MRKTSAIRVPLPGPSSTRRNFSGQPFSFQLATHQIPIISPNACQSRQNLAGWRSPETQPVQEKTRARTCVSLQHRCSTEVIRATAVLYQVYLVYEFLIYTASTTRDYGPLLSWLKPGSTTADRGSSLPGIYDPVLQIINQRTQVYDSYECTAARVPTSSTVAYTALWTALTWPKLGAETSHIISCAYISERLGLGSRRTACRRRKAV